MKCLLGVVFLFSSFSLFSSVHLVDNSVNAPEVFNNLQKAIDFAAEGDTIFIKGTFMPYEGPDEEFILVNKQLVFFGEGAFKTKDGAINQGEYTSITWLALTKGANGSKFSGLHIKRLHFSNTPGEVSTFSDLSFFENHIERLSYESNLDNVKGITFINNRVFPVYDDFDWSFMSDLTFRNNFIYVRKEFKPSIGNNIVSNNFIRLSGTFSTRKAYGTGPDSEILYEREWEVENVSMQNNVFYMNPFADIDPDRIAFRISNVTLKSNISINRADVGDLYAVDNMPNDVSDLITEAQPFVSEQSVMIEFFRNLDFESALANLNLKTDSQGVNAGTDGTDIGIYGGAHVWPDGPNHRYELGIPLGIPVIELLETRKTVVKPGEGLKVRIKARANN